MAETNHDDQAGVREGGPGTVGESKAGPWSVTMADDDDADVE